MDSLTKDLRYALRSLLRTRGLSTVAVLCMGLGIGVCATLFATVNPWLFRPLPYAEPDRLMALGETSSQPGASGRQDEPISGPNYLDWTLRSRSFDGAGAFDRTELNLSTEEEPRRVTAARVTATLFPLLGKLPALGRGFGPNDDRPGGQPVVLLSHELWRRHFGGDPKALGQTLKLDGELFTVVGVMPPGFAFPEYAEVWTPLRLEPGGKGRGEHRLDAIARLRPGVTVEQARAELGTIAASLEQEHPDTNRGRGARVLPLLEDLTPPGVVAALRLLLVAGLLVQLIACANVANLMLARAAAQRQENAVRLALGARRGQLLRQSLVEALLLVAAGAGLGLVLASQGVRWLMGLSPISPPFWVSYDLDGRAVAFTVAVTTLSALVVSLAPVLQASRADVRGALTEGARTVAGGPRGRLGRALVVSELGLSLVLLIGAALMVKSFMHRFGSDAGFDTRDVLTARLALSGKAYADPKQRATFLEELERRLRQRPEVQEAGIANGLPFPDPLYGGWWERTFEVEGQQVERERLPTAAYSVVTAGYLRATGLPLVEGRLFNGTEEAEGRDVVVVSDGLARRLWGGDALGRRLRLEGGSWLQVVGVVKQTRDNSNVLGVGTRPEDELYVPYRRDAWDRVSVVVRTRSAPAAFAPLLRDTVRALDPGLPLHSVFTLDEVRLRSVWLAQMWGRMLGAMAAFALLLAGLGVYGVVSYAVSQRTHELGIRMAVGAGRGDVFRLVLGQGLRLASWAVAAGLLGAIALSGALAGLLYGVDPLDPPTLGGAAVTLTLIALVASYGPARRATRVDPLVALRSD